MDFPSISCDWLTISHRIRCGEQVQEISGGRTLKLDRDGVIDYEALDWEKLYCPSSDTSLRIRCDGQRLQMTGNVSRWKQENNLLGLTVVQCIEVWRELLDGLGFDVLNFGERFLSGTVGESGTYLTRVDLAGNLETDNFSALTHSILNNRIGQRAAKQGKYGPMWGYDSKRANWWKAKLYDKQCELDGRRIPTIGQTTARFEVQLGSEYLKRENLDIVKNWNSEVMQMGLKGIERVYEGGDVEKRIHRLFADQAFSQAASVNDWDDIPTRLRGIAYAWRGGDDLRQELKRATFYKYRKQLLDFGIDIAVPCNVLAFTARVREVKVTPIHALRRAA